MIVPVESKTVTSESVVSTTEHDGSITSQEGDETSVVGPPPGYTASAVHASTSTSATAATEEGEDSPVPRVNLIYINDKDRNVCGAWTIDPNVRVPRQLLAELPAGDERVNERERLGVRGALSDQRPGRA